MPFLKKFPTSSTGSTSGDGSNGTWSNPNRIFVTDGSYATSAYWVDGGGFSGTLQGSAFGYALPAAATIDGIQVDIIGGFFNRIGQTFIAVGTASKTAIKNTPVVTNGTIGGPTDLWGRTDWTVSDINDASFFASWAAQASSSPADAQANIDSISVTVYYHIATSQAPADVETREVYKVYNQQGQYIGNLPQPTEVLKVAQDINSIGSQINLTIPKSADTSANATEVYTTEDLSENYTTEDALQDYNAENELPIVSTAFQGIDTLIKNGNTVKILHYNYFYPNGKTMFVGKIRRWEANFGGSGNDEVTVALYSTGYDTDNYITRGSPFVYTTDQSQTAVNQWDRIYSEGGGWYLYGQSFTVGAGVTNIGAITIRINAVANITINLFSGGTLIGTTTQAVNTTGDTNVQFGFPALIPVTAGNSYFFEVRPAVGQSAYIIYQTTNVYANGTAYTSAYSGGSGGGAWTPIAGDLYFVTASGTPTTTTTFTNKDPSTEMLAPIITDYNLRGGSQTWSAATIDATGLSLTYTFKVQTIYEALQAVLSLAPSGFYYCVDLGTQTIYFKNQSTTADFLLVKGVHINSLKLTTTTEGSKNTILLTGGDTGGGVNLYKQYISTQSIAAFGPLLDRKSDTRVTVSATADAIGTSSINELAGEQYQTTVTIPHSTRYDITLYTVGKVVGFRSFGTFVDGLLMLIVRREWTAEAVTLTLGTLPKRLNTEYENTMRQLIAKQTQNNPSQPS